MKKIFLIAPAFLLFACGGEEAAEDAIESVEGTVEDVVETIEEVVPEPATYVSGLSSEADVQAFLETKSWESEEPHVSGLYAVIDNPGDGDARPTLNDEVTIFYQGFLLDGTKFDGTVGNNPMIYPLAGFIEGWKIGIPMFGKNGSGKLIIPSDLAYGDRDNGEIPAGSTLMFEIHLVDWKPAM